GGAGSGRPRGRCPAGSAGGRGRRAGGRREGRPVTPAKGQATRRRLIGEAVRRFGRGGYDGTSLDAVASAAGVRKQTLLYYFPTKETLLEACVGEVSARVAAALADALSTRESESAKAETVIRAVFGLAERWPDFPQ